MHKNRIVNFGALLTVGALAGLAACSATAPGEDAAQLSAGQAAGPDPLASGTTPLNAGLSHANAPLRVDGARRVFGVVATGKTPDAAAESFRQKSAAELGVGVEELAPARISGSATLK